MHIRKNTRKNIIITKILPVSILPVMPDKGSSAFFFKKSGNLSAMIKGNRKLEVLEYTSVDELPTKLKQLFQ